jgi:hypothetical protein
METFTGIKTLALLEKSMDKLENQLAKRELRYVVVVLKGAKHCWEQKSILNDMKRSKLEADVILKSPTASRRST